MQSDNRPLNLKRAIQCNGFLFGEKKKENHNSVNFTVLDASAVRHILGKFKSQKFLFTCCVD